MKGFVISSLAFATISTPIHSSIGTSFIQVSSEDDANTKSISTGKYKKMLQIAPLLFGALALDTMPTSAASGLDYSQENDAFEFDNDFMTAMEFEAAFEGCFAITKSCSDPVGQECSVNYPVPCESTGQGEEHDQRQLQICCSRQCDQLCRDFLNQPCCRETSSTCFCGFPLCCN